MTNKKYYIIGFSLVALLIAITIGASYAYFTATVNNDGDLNPTVITTGHMELLFSDGQDVSASNLMPGDSVTKTFKVKNTGDIDSVYDIYLSEIINNFANKEELQYKLSGECTSDNNYHQAPANVGNESKIVSSCPIEINEEHEYTLEIKFIETNDVQDYNKGKTFSAKIGINEYDYGTMIINVHTDENTYTIARKIGQELGELETPSVEVGYIFEGWYGDSLFTNVVSSNTVVSSDLSDIYAKIKINNDKLLYSTRSALRPSGGTRFSAWSSARSSSVYIIGFCGLDDSGSGDPGFIVADNFYSYTINSEKIELYAGGGRGIGFPMQLEPGETYIFTAGSETYSSYAGYANIFHFTSSGNYISSTKVSNGVTFTIPTNAGWTVYEPNAGGSLSVNNRSTIVNPKIEKVE